METADKLNRDYTDIYGNPVFNAEIKVGTDGENGTDGVGISSITQGTGSNIVVTLTNSAQYTIAIPTVKGDKGDTGNTGNTGTNGSSITITSTSHTDIGSAIRVTIDFSDSTVLTFDIPKGTNGTNGTNGSNGTNGTNGTSFRAGYGVPSDAIGNNGDSYVNLNNGDVYNKVSGTYSTPVYNLKGATGSTGPTGPTGPTGATGASQTVVVSPTTPTGTFKDGDLWMVA